MELQAGTLCSQPTRPRGGSSSRFLKGGEGFQARQLLLPRHCSAACPLPLFYLQMPFYLCRYCWENPPLAGGRGSCAASCSAAVSRAASGTKAVKVPLNTGHHRVWLPTPRTRTPAAIPFPNPTCPGAAGACRPVAGHISLSWQRNELNSVLNPQKSPYKAVLEPGGWRGAAGRANRKPGLAAGKCRAAGCLPAWHRAQAAPAPAPLSRGCSGPREGGSLPAGGAFLLCRIRLSKGFMRW